MINLTDNELLKIAKLAMKNAYVKEYLKRVLTSTEPEKFLSYEIPLYLAKTTSGLKRFQVRLSTSLKNIVLDEVNPDGASRESVFTGELIKLIPDDLAIELGLKKATTTTTTSTTTRKTTRRRKQSSK